MSLSGVGNGYVDVKETREVLLNFSKIPKSGLTSNLPKCCPEDVYMSDKELTAFTIALMKEVDKAHRTVYRYGYRQKRVSGSKGCWQIIVEDIGE